MKKIMILGCGVYQIPLISYACKHYTVILVAPKIPQNVITCVAKCYFLDLREQDKILQIAQKEQIDGIITDQTDIPVRSVAYVAEHMNLPGISYKTACLFTNKYLMREKLKELNLPTIPYKSVFHVDEACTFAKTINYPVIIKPVDNQGSRGVCRADNDKQLREKFKIACSASPSQQVIIEKCIIGKEAVVEGLVMNYQYQPLIFGDTAYFDIADSFAAKIRLFPSKLPTDLKNKILSLNKAIIEGFGLKQGITHSEFIIDENDEVYLIETAARGGGVFISSDLIALGTGLNTEKFLTEIAVNGTADYIVKNTEKTYCYIAFFLPKGEVISVDGIDKVKSFPFVHRNLLDTVYVGLKTKEAKDKTSRFSIIVSANSYNELERNIELIKQTLTIEVQTENGIQSPIWE